MLRGMREARVRTGEGTFGQRVSVGPHELVADEPVELGGDDRGLAPHEFVLSGLGACTSMTLAMYAKRKGWPLVAVDVTVALDASGPTPVLRRRITLEGPLDDDQRARLLAIAEKCPVHKLLTAPPRIESELTR